MFDYTGKTLLTPPEFDKLVARELLRVKSLKCGRQWVKTIYSKKPRYELYEDDPVTKLKGVGKVTGQFLHVHKW